MKSWLVGIVGLIALMSVGCGGGGTGSVSYPDPTVRYFNVVPDSTALTFSIDSDIKASSLGYLTSTSDFVSTKAKDVDFSFRENAESDPIDVLASTPAKNSDYAVIAFGQESVATSEPIKRARITLLPIDRKAPSGNKAKLIVFHGFSRATGFETPNIDLQNPGDTPQFFVRNIAFGESSSLTVDSGSQTFQIRRNGTEQVYVEQTVTLGAGKIYLVIVGGIEGATGAIAPSMNLVEISPRTDI